MTTAPAPKKSPWTATCRLPARAVRLLSRWALCVMFAAPLTGCGSAKPEVKLNRWGRPISMRAEKPPGWVDDAPKSTKGMAYAVGFSKPTFWPQDALTNAAEDARGKLALGLSSNTEAYRQELSTGSGEQSQLTLTKEATDLVMQNSRIDKTWVDEAGVRDEPGSVFCLASISMGGQREQVAVAEGAAGANDKTNRMPRWLNRLPSSSSRLYAAGYSGPTFRPEDALQYAGDQAVQNLASTLRSRVQAYQLLVETQTGLSVDDFSRTANPDEEFLELVRKNARVEQVWLDEDGVRAGDPPGAVWALAGIDVNSTKGGYNRVENADTGPALDPHGNVPAKPQGVQAGSKTNGTPTQAPAPQ